MIIMEMQILWKKLLTSLNHSDLWKETVLQFEYKASVTVILSDLVISALHIIFSIDTEYPKWTTSPVQ